jgi:hypothetical protein
MKTELIEKAKAYGIKCHSEVNQKSAIELVFASAWTHDIIEDARKTYA